MGKWNAAANEIFLQALELDSPDELQTFLVNACGTDSELRAEVESLLAAKSGSGSFLESPATGIAPTLGFVPIAEKPGMKIDRYKLVHEIGHGGMGVVYMAVQKEPVKRRVALKIIKPGMDTREVVTRFEGERQALALMDHPSIAKVLDGGSTESGRPYFVMELVDGTPITTFCDEARYNTRQRLELFGQVCQAVQHAHQKGIIHRDLKPSNILVTNYDHIAVPKVIDFGIARAIHQPLTDQSVYTNVSQMIGTPLYMSPEQAQRSGLDIDTRTDVYSLGVLLYELLTGTTPFDKERLQNSSLDEVKRIIREEEPPKPSTRFSTLNAAQETVAEKHSTNLRTLSHEVHGELDWIVMKSLEKDRNRRYESANELAKDIQRYLHDAPVEACPPTRAYRFDKFARRNKTALTTTALVALALLIGTGVATWQAKRASEKAALAIQESSRANLESKRAKQNLAIAVDAVDRIYTEVVDQWVRAYPESDPLKLKLLNNTRIFYTMLTQANPADSQLREYQADAHLRLGQIHWMLGDLVSSNTAYTQAAHHFEQLWDADPSEPQFLLKLGRCYHGKGSALRDGGRFEEALLAHTQAVDVLATLVTENSEDPEYSSELAFAHLTRGLCYSSVGQFEASLEDFRSGFTVQEKVVAAFPENHSYRHILAGCYHHYAQVSTTGQRFDEALNFFHRSINLLHDRAESRDARWQLGLSYESLAAALRKLNEWEQADEVCQKSNQVHEALVEDFPNVPYYRMTYVDSLTTSTDILIHFEDFAEAELALLLAIEQSKKMMTLSRQHKRFYLGLPTCYQRYARFLRSRERSEEAVDYYRQALGACEESLTFAADRGASCRVLVFSTTELTRLLSSLGRDDEAEAIHRDTFEIVNKCLAVVSEQTRERDDVLGEFVRCCHQYARFLLLRGRLEEAEDYFRRARLATEESLTFAPDRVACNDRLLWNTIELTDLLVRLGRRAEAQAMHDDTVQTFEACLSTLPDKSRDRGEVLDELAWLLTATPLREKRRPAEAVSLSEKAVKLAPNGCTWHTLGVGYFRSDALLEAVEALQTSMNLSQWDAADFPGAYMSCSLAVVHARLNDLAAAQRWLERATQLLDREPYMNPALRDLHAEAAETLASMKSVAPQTGHE